jgi:hypothetical protein
MTSFWEVAFPKNSFFPQPCINIITKNLSTFNFLLKEILEFLRGVEVHTPNMLLTYCLPE